jgi:hypothetical protein
LEPWAVHLLTFLAGTATGAAGSYYASKFTDQRRKQEAKSETNKEFRETCALMKKLIAEMKADLDRPNDSTVREFAILANERIRFNSSKKRFRYHEDVHEDLCGKVGILESRGYVIDVSTSSVPICKMTQDFVALVRSS